MYVPFLGYKFGTQTFGYWQANKKIIAVYVETLSTIQIS